MPNIQKAGDDCEPTLKISALPIDKISQMSPPTKSEGDFTTRYGDQE